MVRKKAQVNLIDGPAGKLEVAMQPADEEGVFHGEGYCALICHPHPLHGGTMDNKVVTTLARVYTDLGIPALRFNFRGVGASEGEHDEGVGEVDDLMAVAAWAEVNVGARRPLLAGFSFGSSVAGNGALRLADTAHLTLVAPPVGRYRFADTRTFPCPLCVVMGDRDELVDPGEVYAWADSLEPPPARLVLPEAGHFFHGQLVPLREKLMAVVADQLR